VRAFFKHVTARSPGGPHPALSRSTGRGRTAGAFFCLVWLSVLASRATAQTQPVPAAGSDPILPQALDLMYRGELGKLYRPADANKLLAAHRLIEHFFAANQQDQRKAIVAQLAATQVDVNVLGRLARLRMDWPALAGGVYYINERVGPYAVHYFLGVPKTYDRTKPWPLVIKLPTADAFVAEPKPNADDVQRIYTKWMTEELNKHPDALCVMPLLNLDELWGPSYAGMNSVIQPMLHVAGRCNVDPARVYLLGHSMSAHAAWNLALNYPTYFAAFDALAGSATQDWQRLRVANLRNTLPVMWHDVNDPLIKVAVPRSLAAAMKRLGIEYDYEETRNVGHVPTDEIVERTYGKMRATLRNLYPPRVAMHSNRPEPTFNRVDWLQIYQPGDPGDDHRLQFRRGTGHMIVATNTWTADATLTRETNHIDIKSDNVEVMRLYVNDQMLDFAKPVTVTVNKKTRFEGQVKTDLAQMLDDQLFLGRGWRYFSGVIDIDLAPSAPTTRPASRASTSTAPPARN
jgi:pimeloyl-ACP methyl ester carboxylesterase